MSSTNWKDIAELVGIAAIVASVVFVGLQMRQSHEIALAEIYQARTNAVMDWNHTLASSEFALGAFEKSASGTQLKISALENRASFAMVTSALFAWENSHYQVSLGYLPQEHWVRAEAGLRANLTDPIWRRHILAQLSVLRPSFARIVEQIAEETSSAAGND